MLQLVIKLYIAASVMFICISFPCYSANFYVRSGASGSNNGTSWTNAWDNLALVTGLSAGDKVYMAGGTYVNTLTVANSGNANTEAGRIHFIRVRSTDTVAEDVDWDAGYDSQVVITGFINLNGKDYVTVDGRIDNGIFISRGIGAVGVGDGGVPTDYITLRYLTIEGPGYVIDYGGVYGSRGIDLTPSTGSPEGLLVEYCDIYNQPSQIYLAGSVNAVIQYNKLHHGSDSHTPPGDDHENVLYDVGSTGLIFRFNTVHDYQGEGVFSNAGASDWKVYGNVFYNGGYSLDTKEGYTRTDIYFYNNTLDNVIYGPRARSTDDHGSFSNNLCHSPTCSPYSVTDNVTRITNWSGTSDPGFTDMAGHNYSLTASATALINTGTALGSLYNVDITGKSRPQGGLWDIGAYEYGLDGVEYPTSTGTISGSWQ